MIYNEFPMARVRSFPLLLLIGCATLKRDRRSVTAGRYRARANVIEVPAAIVESFASGWIAQQLKARNGLR